MNHVRATLARMGRDVAHEVVVNVFAALALTAIAFVALGGRMEDLYTRLRGDAAISGEVTVLGIDEEALYLWDPTDPEPEVTPRALLAELVRFLSAAGAHVIVIDVLTDRPASGDDLLGLAVAGHGRVVAAERFAPGPGGAFAPASVLEAATPGFANLGIEEQTLFSGEMSVRAVPLVARVARARIGAPFPAGLVGAFQDDGAPVAALALAAAWLHRTDAPADTLRARLASACAGSPCADAGALGLPPTPVPLDTALPLNLRGPEGGDHIPLVPAARVLRSVGESALARTLGMDLPIQVPTDLEPLLRDKVVVVGRVDAAAADRFVTAYSFPTLQTADMAGVRIHAQLIDTLLTGRHLRDPGPAVPWGLALVTGLACWASRTRLDDAHLPVWLGIAALLLGTGAAVFARTDGLVVDVGPALAALSLLLIAHHLYRRNAEDP